MSKQIIINDTFSHIHNSIEISHFFLLQTIPELGEKTWNYKRNMLFSNNSSNSISENLILTITTFLIIKTILQYTI